MIPFLGSCGLGLLIVVRDRSLMTSKWKYRICSYKDGQFRLETVHKSIASADFELKINQSIGRTARVTHLESGLSMLLDLEERPLDFLNKLTTLGEKCK